MAAQLQDLQRKWKQLLRDNQWKPLFDSLAIYLDEAADASNTALLLQSEYNRTQKRIVEGTMTQEQITVTYANLTHRVSSVIGTIETEDLVPDWQARFEAETRPAEDTPAQPPVEKGAGSEPGDRPTRPQPKGTIWFAGIGINTYTHWPQLYNAVRDMEAVAELLRQQYGVQVKAMLRNEEATLKNITDLFDRLSREIVAPDSLILYYSGHGHLDTSNNKGFLVPTDAEKASRAGFIRNSTLKDYFQDAKAQHLLFVSDACFSGSLLVEKSLRSPEQMVLTELAARPSRWVMCSGRHNEAVSDGPRGQHSPFAQALLDELRYNQKPGINAALLAQLVQYKCKEHYEDQLTDYGPIAGVGDQRGQLVFWRGDAPVVVPDNNVVLDHSPDAIKSAAPPIPPTRHPLSPSEKKGIEDVMVLTIKKINKLRETLALEDDPIRSIRYEEQLRQAEAELEALRTKLT